MKLAAPVIPGLTESAEGSDQMQLIAQLATMRLRRPKQFDALFRSFGKLFTPQEPPAEPQFTPEQPSTGQALAGLLGQPSPSQPVGLQG